jgi:uncharacterized protein YndB with AHSA1/START domain
MARFTVSVDVAAPVERVWERLTDWPQHGRWIPLTTVRVTSARPDGVGATFLARTGIGPIGFDDPMEIVEWTAPADGRPGFCKVRKHGRVILGWASCEVASRPGGSTVSWTEDVEVAPVRFTRPIDRLIGAGGKIGFTRALRAMAKEIETEVAGSV